MASNNSDCGVLHGKVPRIASRDGFRALSMDVTQDGCHLAVSGCRNMDTFIDVFALRSDPDSQDKSLIMESEPYFSKEFAANKSAPWRHICLMDDSLVVTCFGIRIELYDIEHGGLVNTSKLASATARVRCMATEGGTVYVGLHYSKDVLVFDGKLKHIKTITLKGLALLDYPNYILAVNNKTLYIRTTPIGKVFMFNIEGALLGKLKTPNEQYPKAMSVTVSEQYNLIYILWSRLSGGKCVVVYPRSEQLSIIRIQVNSPPHDCHCFASFSVSDDSLRIRINNKVNRLYLVTEKTGEIYEYRANDIINHENLLSLIELLLDGNDCQKLLKYFQVPVDKAKVIKKSTYPSVTLLQHLREMGKLSSENIQPLLEACSDKGISKVSEAWRSYQQFLSSHKFQHLKEERREMTDKLKEGGEKETSQEREGRMETTEERQQLSNKLEKEEKERQEMTNRLKELNEAYLQLETRLNATEEENELLREKLTESDKEKQKAAGRLEAIDGERSQLKERLEAKEDEKEQLLTMLKSTEGERQQLSDKLSTKVKELQNVCDEETRLKRIVTENHQELEETKSRLKDAKDELVKTQVKHVKESMALQEVLQQTREALNKQRITPTDSLGEGHKIPEENETSEILEESSALAADFAALMVDVAEDLTLDNVLQLAYLLQLPDSEKDMLRRISLFESPGITLMKFLQARKIINMYDVTNLEKSLKHLKLYRTYKHYVVPYKQKIDQEESQSPDLYDWPDEKAEASKENDTSVLQQKPETSEDVQTIGEKEELTEKNETSKIQDIQTTHTMPPYIEHKINCEGGFIALMGVGLSIPDGALPCDRVIAVTVIRDPDVILPGCAQRGRLTPLVKLEPEGLELNKPARLTIPHSAIIPEPTRHSVMVFTGLQRKGHITWTEEKSLERMLNTEKISLNIHTLSYISVNLVSQEMEQKHVFRIVPFIDGILDDKDDVLITVCFCEDNDADYNLLLEDFKSKLTLGDYTTFQVSRAPNGDRDAVSCIELVMSSQGDSYHLHEEDAKQVVDADHLCAASRVYLQYRLERRTRRDGDTEMVDVRLTVSQRNENQIILTLRSRLKDILLSPKSQALLFGEVTRDLQQYESLKEAISRQLDKHQCEKLAVFFGLTPAENDKIQKDAESGMVLMKILDERELIMPDKMIGLYEGLKASHLNKLGSYVLEYVDTLQKEKLVKTGDGEDELLKKLPTVSKEGVPGETEESTLSRKVELLIGEGYKRTDVQRALKLSRGKVDLARKLLRITKDEHVLGRCSLFTGSTLYQEQYLMNMEERWTYFLFASLFHLVHYTLDLL